MQAKDIRERAMGYPTKIATCCYCGSRAVLVLGKGRHELTCGSCGAPLHDMKRLRSQPLPDRPRKFYPQDGARLPYRQAHTSPKRRKVKKRKSLMQYLVKEAFDVIEDIFD